MLDKFAFVNTIEVVQFLAFLDIRNRRKKVSCIEDGADFLLKNFRMSKNDYSSAQPKSKQTKFKQNDIKR